MPILSWANSSCASITTPHHLHTTIVSYENIAYAKKNKTILFRVLATVVLISYINIATTAMIYERESYYA